MDVSSQPKCHSRRTNICAVSEIIHSLSTYYRELCVDDYIVAHRQNKKKTLSDTTHHFHVAVAQLNVADRHHPLLSTCTMSVYFLSTPKQHHLCLRPQRSQ